MDERTNLVRPMDVQGRPVPAVYEVLKHLSVHVPKRNYTTLWSCRADATKALSQGYLHFLEALNQITDDGDELGDVRCKAHGLSGRMLQLETDIYTDF